jgi:hypothetical protein
VDGKNKLIVAAEVSNQQTDKRLLGAMVEQTIELKNELGIEEKSEIVADAGYFNETDVLAHQQGQAIRVTVPITAEGERGTSARGEFGGKISFATIPEPDIWACPLGAMLRRIIARPVVDKNGRMTWKYQANGADCVACSKKGCCAKGSENRMLRVSVHHEELKTYFEELENP